MVSRPGAFTGSPDAGKQGGFGNVFSRGGEAPVQLGRQLQQTFDGTLGAHPVDERSEKLRRAGIDSEQMNFAAVDNPGRHIPNIGDRSVYDEGRFRRPADLLTILIRPFTLYRREVRIRRNLLDGRIAGFPKAAQSVVLSLSLPWGARDWCRCLARRRGGLGLRNRRNSIPCAQFRIGG